MAIGSVFGPLNDFGNNMVEPLDPRNVGVQVGLDTLYGVPRDTSPLTRFNIGMGRSLQGVASWLQEPGPITEWATGIMSNQATEGGLLDRALSGLDKLTGGNIFSDYGSALRGFEPHVPDPGFDARKLQSIFTDAPPRPEYPTFPDFNTLGAQLEANRQKLVEARNAAVRKNGAAAAAPYNQAIAQLDAEIAKMQEANVQKDQLFGGISDRTSAWYDKAIEAAQPVAADASMNQMLIRGRILEEQGKIMTGIKANMMNRFRAINGGGEVAAVASAGLEEIENQIYADTEARHISRENIARATGAVMEASARLARASNRTELERQRLMVQFQIDEQVDQMLEQRKELVSRRNAAVAAARKAAFDAFGDIAPGDQHSYAFAHVQQYVFNMMQGRSQPERDGMLEYLNLAFSGAQPVVIGAEGEVGRIKTLRDARYFMASIQEISGVPFSPDDFDFYTRLVFEASVIYAQGADTYSIELTSTPPEVYKPGSVDRYAALYASITNTNPLVSPDEADAYARDPRNHEVYIPAQPGRPQGEQVQPRRGVTAG